MDDEKREFWDSFGEAPKGPSKDRKDFWDDFGGADEPARVPTRPTPKANVGTAAMRKGGGAGAAGAGVKKQDDLWGDW